MSDATTANTAEGAAQQHPSAPVATDSSSSSTSTASPLRAERRVSFAAADQTPAWKSEDDEFSSKNSFENTDDENGCSPDHGLDDDGLDWPEESGTASLPTLVYRRWTFSYMGRILRKGSRAHSHILDNENENENDDDEHRNGEPPHNLTQADLYRVPPTMDTAYLDHQFHTILKAEHNHLLKTLWRLASPTFIPAAFCQLLTVLAQVAIPLLVMQVLLILEQNPYQNVARQGILYVVLIFVASAINALGTHRQRHLAMKSGIVLRAAVVSAVYRRALTLTPEGRSGLTTGEVTNLVATDAQKIYEVMQEGHLIWSCPLSMVLVSVLLLVILGPTTLVGIAVLVLFVPLTTKITAKMIAVRKQRVRVTDKRIELINAMLQGIKVTKLNNYEAKYLERIKEARERELQYLRKELYIWGITLSVTVITPVLASAVTYVTYVLVSEDNILTASKTFTTLLLFSALRFPINYAGRLIGKAAQAYESAKRISRFMTRETKKSQFVEGEVQTLDGKDDAAPILEVRGIFRVGGGSIKMGNDKSSWDNLEPGSVAGGFTLTGIDLAVSRGSILAIAGPVGCGKSTLISSIIGEVSCSPNTIISHHGRIAYASQIPFILNATLRENILFGSLFHRERYEKVIDACCLRQDIEQMEAGDLTEIGERGITLSGGQKQRVSLARLVYSKPDLALLDDPLSALDAGTARKVFDRVLKNPDRDLLGSSAIVLVTHASHFLRRMDNIIVLVDGRPAFQGSWDELSAFHCQDPDAETAINAIRSSLQEEAEDDQNADDNNAENDVETTNAVTKRIANLPPNKPKMKIDRTKSGKLMQKERREQGLSSISIWLLWFKHAGGWCYVLVLIISLGIDRTAYVGTEWWLARWTQAADEPVMVFGVEFPSQSDGIEAQYQWLKVYAIILAISCVAASQRSIWAVRGGAVAARSLFYMMTERTLLAPLSFFETTPLGRVLNRFTYDIETLDHLLVENMSVLLIAMSWFVAGVCVMGAILPWIILALIPVTAIYWMLQLHYRKSGADLQRLDAVSRSPIQAMLSEGIDGAATIRVYGQEERFLHRFQSSASTNTSAQLNFVSAQRWLGVRIELLGAVIVFVSTLLVVIFNGTFAIDAGLVALLVIWSSNYNITLGFLVDHVSEAEAAITCVERINAMTELPQEKSMFTNKEHRPPSSWPSSGTLEFQDVALRYRPGLPLALDGLSFTVEAGRRCGVVGRTGAGKSSLTVALFRLVELEFGQILLDGVDLANLGLSDVRGRPNGMCIIPQDPVLFSGTMREVLDPFGMSKDDDIYDALICVRLCYGRGMEILDEPVDEGGANFSVGERQLICLARAMLSKPKLLVLDEATASVDGETDAFVQKMLRSKFKGTTLLTVAHRLNTILDYDTVLVMDKGRAVEYGPPDELLQNESGIFTELVNNTGKESAKALKKMASSINLSDLS